MASEIFSKLLAAVTPQNDSYFIQFNKLAKLTVNASMLLTELTANENKHEFEKIFEEIRKIECSADDVTKDVLLSLHRSFITPFDRREIRELVMALDDIIDYIEEIPLRASLYGRHAFTGEMAALSNITLNAARKVAEAVSLLSDMKNSYQIIAVCQDIHQMENEADSIMRLGIKRLFNEVTDARELICNKELYDLFEAAVDSCEDVADAIHGVVLERV
jgi:uncharacterized protein